MHHAVELILKRMESHPEDFVQGAKGTWLHQIDKNKKYFNQEETDKVKDKLREINLDQMTQNLMESMVEDEEVESAFTGWENIPSQPSKILTTSEMIATAQKIMRAELEKGIAEMEEDNPFKLEEYALGFDVEVNKDWEEE